MIYLHYYNMTMGCVAYVLEERQTYEGEVLRLQRQAVPQTQQRSRRGKRAHHEILQINISNKPS